MFPSAEGKYRNLCNQEAREDPRVILRTNQNAHQNMSKGKPITFYFQKALIFYSCHYVLKSAQVFIGSYPVQSCEGGDTCFSSCLFTYPHLLTHPWPHQCCSNSVSIWSCSCVFPHQLPFVRLPRVFYL